MVERFSRTLIVTTIEFIRAAKADMGDDLGEERANAMLDAFDPTLKNQVFMELLMGNIGSIKIRRYDNYHYKKINAIKAVRNIAGLGLKEAKELVDGAVDQAMIIPGSYGADEQRQLRGDLHDTGYEVV